jgi:hypothetical protein
MRSFDLELAFGAEYGDTAATADGKVLVSSRMPTRDACIALLAAGADPNDRVTFRRDGRFVGAFKIDGPTRWPDQPHHLRNGRPASATRAGATRHSKAFGQ